MDAPLSTGRTQDTITGDLDNEQSAVMDVEGVNMDGNEDEVDEENDDEGEVVVPKPLNDVSNVFFSNSVTTMRHDETNALDQIPELHPRKSQQSPSVPSSHLHNTQSSSVPFLEPDDSWISNPSMPYFHRLSDLDASEAFQHSVNDTLATVTDAVVAGEQLETKENEDINDSAEGRSIAEANEGTSNVELLETARSQKTPSSYHSDVDEVAADAKSENDVAMTNSKRRLQFDTEESQHDSDGFVAHRTQENIVSMNTSPHLPQVSASENRVTDQDFIDAENPTRLQTVSRTSPSPSPRSVSSRGSARKAAMYRREYERHRHGDDSSDEEGDYRLVRQKPRSPDSGSEFNTSPEVHQKSPSIRKSSSGTDTGGYRSDQSEQSDQHVASHAASRSLHIANSRLVRFASASGFFLTVREGNVFTGDYQSVHRGGGRGRSKVPSWPLVPCPFKVVGHPWYRIPSEGDRVPGPFKGVGVGYTQGYHRGGRYASYWNAFLHTLLHCLLHCYSAPISVIYLPLLLGKLLENMRREEKWSQERNFMMIMNMKRNCKRFRMRNMYLASLIGRTTVTGQKNMFSKKRYDSDIMYKMRM